MDNDEVDGGIGIGGRELRWLLTLYLKRAGSLTVQELAAALRADGYVVHGRESKVISDSLRWEIRWRRVVRLRRGVYAFGRIPRSTEYRMRKGLAAMLEWHRRWRITRAAAAAGLPEPVWAPIWPPGGRIPSWGHPWEWLT